MKNCKGRCGFSVGAVWLIAIGLCAQSYAWAATDKVEIIQGKGATRARSGTNANPNPNRLDQDGNKKLSMDELLAEHQRQIKAFVEADKNKDGELSSAERKVFKKSIKLKACA